MNFVDTYSLFLHSMKEIATKMSYVACLQERFFSRESFTMHMTTGVH